MDTASLPAVGIKPLLSWQRHPRAGLWTCLLVLVLGFPLVLIKGQSVYTSASIFQVSPRYMKTLQADAELELQSNQQYREYVNHLSQSLLRYDVLARALETLRQQGLNPKPSAWSDRKYIEKLQTSLFVHPLLDTYMVRVGLSGGKRDRPNLHEVVNAVMASFLETTKDEQIYGSSERLNVLRDSLNALTKEVQKLTEERVGLGEKLGLTTFLEQTENPYDALLVEARERLSAAQEERSRAAAIYATFLERRELPADLGKSLLELKLSDLGLQAQRAEVTKRLEELYHATAGLEYKHPARIAAEAQVAAMKQRLSASEDAFDRQTFDNFQQRLQASLDGKKRIEEDLRAGLLQLESQSNSYAHAFQDAMRLTRDIKEREDRLQTIRKRLNYLETERNSLGFVRLVTPAMEAEKPTGLGKTKLLLVLLLLALGAGAAAPILLDLLDPRILSVNTAERIMGIPAAGWQIRREDRATGLFGREQTRRFVSTLVRLRNRQQRNTFAFSSMKSGGGTTTLVIDTACALRELGYRVLVLEANTFSATPQFDQFRPGLTDYLEGRADLDSLPRSYTQGEVTIEVAGVGTGRQPGIKRLDLLSRAIENWSEQYDYLLVDLPPLLLCADAEILIEALGQVFLVVEAGRAVKGELERAKRLLQKLDPQAVGLFVSAVPLFRGGGYMEDVIAEMLTRRRLSGVTRPERWALHWEFLKTYWSSRRRVRRARGPQREKPTRRAGDSER